MVRSKRLIKMVALAACLLVLGWISSASAEKWYEAIEVEGFVDTYYSFNFNTPNSRNNNRNFDTNENQFALSLAELAFYKNPEPVGFRLDLGYGPTAAASNIVSPTVNTEDFRHVQQAYVTYMTPFGPTLKFGKMATHVGYEVIESQDNWNYTRSYLFSNAIPFLHTGLAVEVPVNEMFHFNGYFYNGWDGTLETNDSKTYGVQVGLDLGQLSLTQNWIGGPETFSPNTAANESEWTHVLDTILSLKVTDTLLLAANFDYGWRDLPGGSTNIWTGVAAYGRVDHGDHALSLRFEWFDDKDGTQLGTAPTRVIVKEVTATAEKRLGESSLLVRLEGRYDWATQNLLFDKEAGTNNDSEQGTITLGLVYSF